MYTPALEEVGTYAKDYPGVPVSRHCYMLASLEDTGRWGRYTVLRSFTIT